MHLWVDIKKPTTTCVLFIGIKYAVRLCNTRHPEPDHSPRTNHRKCACCLQTSSHRPGVGVVALPRSSLWNMFVGRRRGRLRRCLGVFEHADARKRKPGQKGRDARQRKTNRTQTQVTWSDIICANVTQEEADHHLRTIELRWVCGGSIGS